MRERDDWTLTPVLVVDGGAILGRDRVCAHRLNLSCASWWGDGGVCPIRGEQPLLVWEVPCSKFRQCSCHRASTWNTPLVVPRYHATGKRWGEVQSE